MMTSVIARYKDEVPVKTEQWSQGLFGCFSNVGICVVSYLLPCVSFGNTAEILGRRNCQNCLLYFIPFYGCYLLAKQRSEIRGLRNIPGSLATDLLCHLTCHCCSLTQENNEATAVHQDIITALGARGLQVIVQGNSITTTAMGGTSSSTAPGYFPGMEPGRSDAEQQPTNSHLHDMVPGPSLEVDLDDVKDTNQPNMDRY